jgi:WD40 repeat protein
MISLSNENILKLALSAYPPNDIHSLHKVAKNATLSKVLLKLLTYEPIYKPPGIEITLLNRYLSTITLLPDGNLILASNDGTLEKWDINNLNNPTLLATLNTYMDSITSLVPLPDNNMLICNRNSKLQLWNTKTNTCIRTIPLGRYKPSTYCPIILSNGNIAMSISRINSDLPNAYIIILNLNGDNNIVKVLDEDSHYSHSLVNLSGGRFASGNSKGLMSVWDIDNEYNCLKSLPGQTSNSCSLAFCKRRNLLFSGSYDSTITLVDMNSYERVAHFNTGQSSIRHVLLLPGGYFVTAYFGVKIWNVKNYECVSTIEGNDDSVLSLSHLKNKKMVSLLCLKYGEIKIYNYK